MRKLVGTALVAATAVLMFATANASAFTGISVGDPVIGTLVSPTVALGTISSCTGSTVSGTVGTDAGAGNGGSGPISSATFSGCTTLGSSSTVTANALPWTLAVDGAGAMTLSGIDVTLRWGFLSCSYRGSITGTYDQTTGDVVLSGSVTRYAGSSLCTTPQNVIGTYNVADQFGSPVQL